MILWQDRGYIVSWLSSDYTKDTTYSRLWGSALSRARNLYLSGGYVLGYIPTRAGCMWSAEKSYTHRPPCTPKIQLSLSFTVTHQPHKIRQTTISFHVDLNLKKIINRRTYRRERFLTRERCSLFFLFFKFYVVTFCYKYKVMAI